MRFIFELLGEQFAVSNLMYFPKQHIEIIVV